MPHHRLLRIFLIALLYVSSQCFSFYLSGHKKYSVSAKKVLSPQQTNVHSRNKNRVFHSNTDDNLDVPSLRSLNARHRRRKLKSVFRKSWTVIAFSLSLLSGAPRVAQAKFSYELGENRIRSLRPGMNKHQAELGLQIEPEAEISLSPDKLKAETEKKVMKSRKSYSRDQTKKSSKQDDFLYADDDDEDYDFTETESFKGLPGNQVNSGASRLKSKSSSQFAAYNKGKSTALTAKVAAAIFVPTFGGMFVREHVRQRKEEAYVKKGLEILEIQKAEYFNVTATTADSDMQDALKELKNKNKTSTTDKEGDDNDDDDDDEDEEDENNGRRTKFSSTQPKRPGGDEPSGGGASGDAGGDAGYGRPSEEDLKRLNNLFDKS